MKRFVSVLLFVLMILSLTGCMSVRVPNVLQSKVEPDPTVITAQAPAVASAVSPTDAPTEAPAEAPAEEPPAASEEPPAEEPAETPAEEVPAETPEETPAEEPEETPAEEVPAEEPAAEPEQTAEEAPFAAAVANAAEKLGQVNSLRMDMRLNVAMAMALMNCQVDLVREPFLARMDVSLSAMGEQMALQLYAAREGDAAVLYLSPDGGQTWQKDTSPSMSQLPQSPADTLGLFVNMDDAELDFTGVQEIDGRPALVYTGDVDGESLKDVLYSTGVIGALGSALGIEVPEQSLLDLGDAEVTFAFDEETGLPVRYSMDMTEVVANLLAALMGESLGGADVLTGMEIPAIVLEVTLSQFDGIETIEIPEAALNAPEA